MRGVAKTHGPQPVVWRQDLRKVYLDPHVSAGLLAYVPEQHASPNCERALKQGRRDVDADPDAPWCDTCTTALPGAATLRRTPTGQWAAA